MFAPISAVCMHCWYNGKVRSHVLRRQLEGLHARFEQLHNRGMRKPQDGHSVLRHIFRELKAAVDGLAKQGAGVLHMVRPPPRPARARLCIDGSRGARRSGTGWILPDWAEEQSEELRATSATLSCKMSGSTTSTDDVRAGHHPIWIALSSPRGAPKDEAKKRHEGQVRRGGQHKAFAPQEKRSISTALLAFGRAVPRTAALLGGGVQAPLGMRQGQVKTALREDIAGEDSDGCLLSPNERPRACALRVRARVRDVRCSSAEPAPPGDGPPRSSARRRGVCARLARRATGVYVLAHLWTQVPDWGPPRLFWLMTFRRCACGLCQTNMSCTNNEFTKTTMPGPRRPGSGSAAYKTQQTWLEDPRANA